MELNFDFLLLQRWTLSIERLFDDQINLDFCLLQNRGAREDQQILHDGCGAARLFKYGVDLVTHGSVNSALANQVPDAEIRGQRIIQFMSHTRHHFAHGRKLFLLRCLLFGALGFGDVAGRGYHSAYFSSGIIKRASTGTQDAPSPIRMLRAVLKLGIGSLAKRNFLERGPKFCRVIRVYAFAQRVSEEIGGGAPEHVLYKRTHEGVNAVEIEHCNHVGKTGDQTTDEFLLLVQVSFHLAALADVNDSSLNAQDVAGCVARSGRGNQAVDSSAVLAAQDNGAVFDGVFFQDFADERITLFRIEINISKIHRLQILFRFVAEHANQGRVYVEEFSIRRAQKDSLAKSGEQLGETNLGLTLGSYVASPTDYECEAGVLADRLHPALKVAGLPIFFQFDRNDATPRSALQESRKPLLELSSRGRLNEIGQATTDELRKRNIHQLGQAAVGNTNFAVHRQSEDGVVEIIDQIAIVVLRTRDNFYEFVVLSVASRTEGLLIRLIVSRLCRHKFALAAFPAATGAAWRLLSLTAGCVVQVKEKKNLCQVLNTKRRGTNLK